MIALTERIPYQMLQVSTPGPEESNGNGGRRSVKDMGTCRHDVAHTACKYFTVAQRKVLAV